MNYSFIAYNISLLSVNYLFTQKLMQSFPPDSSLHCCYWSSEQNMSLNPEPGFFLLLLWLILVTWTISAKRRSLKKGDKDSDFLTAKSKTGLSRSDANEGNFHHGLFDPGGRSSAQSQSEKLMEHQHTQRRKWTASSEVKQCHFPQQFTRENIATLISSQMITTVKPYPPTYYPATESSALNEPFNSAMV